MTVRWGIAGTGNVAHAFAHALREVDDAELAAVGSRELAKAMNFADQHNISVRYGDYDTLFADPQVDVIYVATPASHHYPHARSALLAGKHVLVEKPFTVNRSQAEALVALAWTKDRLLVEAMWPRFLHGWVMLRQLLEDQRVGEVRMIDAAFGGRADYRPGLRPFRLDLAGGALMDGGVYPIHLAHLVLGEPATVKALAQFGPSGVDEQNVVILGYPEGRLGVTVSAITTTLDSSARIYGTEGMIVVPANLTNPVYLEVLTPDRKPERFECAMPKDRLAYQAVEVQRCLGAGLTESPLMPLAESCAVMGTLDRVREQIGLDFGEAEEL